MRLKKLQFGIGGNFMLANNVKFNPFRLCIHNFQYMSIRFQKFKFDIDVVLFSKKFHKAFVLIFLNHSPVLFEVWSLLTGCVMSNSAVHPDAHLHIRPYHMT